ncbi:type II secretion system protein [Gallaecimonas xiamenensis]|uniref:Methylation site containing protein n=1 Tax=Gallaecimonas xiamenensis 3-C-1 TaxID=745411 RepID=K2IYW9_9GAMM|nr:type II secretion system protein [Gallaecimonas xiamenensis]EKE67727.1 methylation site containing protein [Gallaecimonas xiamenensis 3-C-1]
MQKQQGFTLIELVVVIIILGILAVTAVPKFIDLQDDAKKATAQGVEASIKGAAQMVYAKSLIAGNEDQAAASVAVATIGTVNTVYGYPAAADVKNVIDVSDPWAEVSGAAGTFQYAEDTGCQVVYTEAASASAAAKTQVNCG